MVRVDLYLVGNETPQTLIVSFTVRESFDVCKRRDGTLSLNRRPLNIDKCKN